MAIKGRYVPGAVKVPFVDREEVLAAFDDELAALAGTPRLLSLYGVGGIGKSRLLHELRRRTRDGRAGTVVWSGVPARGPSRAGECACGYREDSSRCQRLDSFHAVAD